MAYINSSFRSDLLDFWEGKVSQIQIYCGLYIHVLIKAIFPQQWTCMGLLLVFKIDENIDECVIKITKNELVGKYWLYVLPTERKM